MQNNDTKHVSESTKQLMKHSKINRLATPTESPDMNPKENLWAELKHFTEKQRKKILLKASKILESVHTEKCNKYINHPNKVIPKLFANRDKQVDIEYAALSLGSKVLFWAIRLFINQYLIN